jgi:pimeloyl-ACP methyl ester carboxylesterase
MRKSTVDVVALTSAVMLLGVCAHLARAAGDDDVKLVDVGGYKLACRVFGQGAPTVVFMSGFRAPQSYWGSIPHAAAQRGTAVTYDRPGYGDSEPGGEQRDGQVVADELRTLLERLDAPEPYIVVAHSLGTVYAPTFVAEYSDSVAGMILLDPGHKDMLDAFGGQLEGAERESWAGYWERIWQRYMAETTPPAREQQWIDRALEQYAASAIPRDMPVWVLSALDTTRASSFLVDTKLSAESIDLYYECLEQYHERLVATWSERGRRLTVEGSSHMIPVDAPDFVAGVIGEMIDATDR